MFSSDIQGCEKFQTLWDIASETTSARQTAYHQMKRSLRADMRRSDSARFLSGSIPNTAVPFATHIGWLTYRYPPAPGAIEVVKHVKSSNNMDSL